MTDKATNIKTKLKLFINNIDELGSTFVTYRALLIKDLLQLTLNLVQDKEQECEKLNSDNRYFVNKIISLELLTDEYEQALNEIEQYRVAEINDEDEAENDTILTIINEVKENTGDR